MGKKYFYFTLISFLLILTASLGKEKYSDIENYFLEIGLVDIRSIDPSLNIDLKYSSTDNFLNEDVYGELNKGFLQKEAAVKLKKAQTLLKGKYPKYSLIILDAVRPRSVQYRMWDIVKGTDKQKYVANPDTGSIHNYGCAVDVSIIDEKGELLDMGTPFDFFGDLAQPRNEDKFFKLGMLTVSQVNNRKLLREVMNEAGFKGILSEWWHFNGFSLKYVKQRYKIIE